MPTIKDEITAIAIDNGYEGAEPSTVKDAVTALADTLAGEDAGSVATIADAIAVLAPYVGAAPSGTIAITENGEGIDVSSYATANVAVPNPSTGTITITENGEGIDVAQYATADVAVSSGGVTIGNRVPIYVWGDMTNPPAANSEVGSTVSDVNTVSIGDSVVFSLEDGYSVGICSGGYAAGVTITTYWMPVSSGETTDNNAYGYVATIDNSGVNPVFATVSAWDGIITKEDGTGANVGSKRFTYTVPALEDGHVLILQYVNGF